MQKDVIEKLIEVNTNFYQQVAPAFDQTRQSGWSGWQRVVTRLPQVQENISVLDLGCGNGRFGKFLHNTLVNKSVKYLGIDNNAALLTEARKNLSYDQWQVELETKDFISDLLDSIPFLSRRAEFDVIALFGVMHHLPSFDLRKKLVAELSRHLSSEGVLAISFWQFTADPRWASRWADPKVIGLQTSDLETNDFILDWRAGTAAYRYCHLVDEQEQHQLVLNLPLHIIDRYEADGANGHSNHYLLLSKKE